MNQWLYQLLLMIGAGATFVGLARRLPWQNVLLASCMIAGIACLVTWLRGHLPGSSHGPEHLWTSAMLWIVLIINSRGLARLVLRARRQTKFYGYEVIFLAALLATIFHLGLEWGIGDGAPGWGEAIFSGGTALLCLLLATPILINKRPQTSSA
jgi:hypothetical protein